MSAHPGAQSGSAGLRIIGRVIAMLALLACDVVLFYLWKLGGGRNPWPRRFLGGIARIAGVRVRITGQIAPGGRLLLANHVSWMDVPALAGATGSAFVAHDGLAGVRLLHWLCAMNDTVFIARHDRASIGVQIDALRAALADRKTLTIFAEGTTSDGTSLLPFKSALLAALDPPIAGVTVQPVWLDYGPAPRAVAWIDREPGMANFKRILARAEPVALTIHFLEPLAAPALANRKTIAAAARQAILRAMAGAPTPLQNPRDMP